MTQIRPYCTFEDVNNFIGFQPEDMEYLGSEMDFPSYKKLIDTLIVAASNLVNRYCNVETFYTHHIVNEYHTLDTIDMYSNVYGIWRQFAYYNDFADDSEKEHNTTIYPREQPVNGIDKVEINLAQNVSFEPRWITLYEYGVPTPQGNLGRDYQVVERFKTTKLKLIYNYPAYGENNVRITYMAGYDDDSAELQNIRIATAMLVNNYLIYKKKMQEVATIRGAGVSDYAPMFNDLVGNRLLTEEVRLILNMYRRQPLDPSMYD